MLRSNVRIAVPKLESKKRKILEKHRLSTCWSRFIQPPNRVPAKVPEIFTKPRIFWL